jgi:zinc protease
MVKETLRDIQRVKLQNGLTVILKEEHSSPVCAIQIWVKAGSARETDEEAGITHLIEHMIFKGTEKRGIGEIAQEIESAGGYINAYTSFDHTVYHTVIAGRFFELGLDVLSDAVQNAAFDSEELRKEKEVVLEEIKRGEDIPPNKLAETLFATAYRVHPYRRPIIGYRKTVEFMDREMILKYVDKWYQPENMNVVIVGDFNMSEVSPKIKKSFESFRSSKVPPFNPPVEPAQTELRAFTLKEDIKEVYMDMAFHIPDVHHEDVYALDVLSFILGQGESSRFSEEVKNKRELVHVISSYTFTPKYPGLFAAYATLKAENIQETLRAVFEEIEKLKHELVGDGELAKAKLNIEADFIYGMENVEGQARKLGEFETVWGDFSLETTYLERIRKVTPQDIQSVVRRYLNPSNLTVGTSLPDTERTAPTAEQISQLANEVRYSIQDRCVKQESQGAAEVQKAILDNGLTLLIKENHAVPTLSVRTVFLGGLRFEDKANNGVSNFVAEMLTKGTKHWSASEIAKEVESIAGAIEGFSGQNSFGLTGHFLGEFFDRAMELMTDIIRHSTFDGEEMRKVRKIILGKIRMQEDSLTHLALRNFNKTLFDPHPYGMNVLGVEETVRRLTKKDLKDFYHRFAVPQNMVMAVVGDVHKDRVVSRIKEILGDFNGKPYRTPQIPSPLPPEIIKTASVVKPREQVHIVLGFLGATLSHEDRYALTVANAILSGMGGRLFTNLRDKQSLAYSVTSFLRLGLDPGCVAVYMATSPDKYNQAVDGIKEELRRLTQEPVSREELSRTKRYLIGNHEIDLQTNSDQAFDLAHNERYGLGYDFSKLYVKGIEAVTADDVLKVVQKYIQLDKYVLATVGPNQE